MGWMDLAMGGFDDGEMDWGWMDGWMDLAMGGFGDGWMDLGWIDLVMDGFGDGWMDLGWMDLAINFIDGLDGLACGITIIVSAVLIVIGIKEQNELVIAISSFLLAGNLAFLRYNFYPAKIFMGETGALFIGLNIAAISTAGTSQYKGITSITLMVPLAVMAVPLIVS